MRVNKAWSLLGAVGIIAGGVAVQAATGGFGAQSVSAHFTGAPTSVKTEQCATGGGHQDKGTFRAVIDTTDPNPYYQPGDVITIDSTSTLAANGEGYTVGKVEIDRPVTGAHPVKIGEGDLEATNTQNGLLDGFILGKLDATHSVFAGNFWVQFSSDGASFSGAFGDGSTTDIPNHYKRDSQGLDPDNHAVVATGDC